MGRLKSNKLKNNTIVIGIITLVGLTCFILFSQSDKYTYEPYLNQILGVKDVKVKNKSLSDSWAVGEWYICETYDLDKTSIDLFISGSHNNLYPIDDTWRRVNWQKLPVETLYQNIQDLVLNYSSTDDIDKQIDRMKTVLASHSGYYSIICKPSFEDPRNLIFFLLSEKGNCLFIIDLKL